MSSIWEVRVWREGRRNKGLGGMGEMNEVDVKETDGGGIHTHGHRCLTGSAVYLRGSFFENVAIGGGGGVRVSCTGHERRLLNCSHGNSICPSSELAGVACPGVFAAWRGCEGWVCHYCDLN